MRAETWFRGTQRAIGTTTLGALMARPGAARAYVMILAEMPSLRIKPTTLPAGECVPSTTDDAISILATALLFFRDCHVFSASYGPVFFCSHDEWDGLFLPADVDTAGVAATFSNWLPSPDDQVVPQ